VRIQRHFDDAADWVFSRCLLADFTSFRDDEADALSSQGRLCCWASVVLRPVSPSSSSSPPSPDEEGEDGRGRPGGGRGDGDGEGENEGGSGGGEGGSDEEWELGFVVHWVGVRDPRGGWCRCF
jgi:hypothetical protein